MGVEEQLPSGLLLTTVENLFGYMRGGQKGMVQIWDVVGFDEVADLQKMPKEVITTMKTYCESGIFQRGPEGASGDASIAMFGNTNQPIDVMVQMGHLFAPMPDEFRFPSTVPSKSPVLVFPDSRISLAMRPAAVPPLFEMLKLTVSDPPGFTVVGVPTTLLTVRSAGCWVCVTTIGVV